MESAVGVEILRIVRGDHKIYILPICSKGEGIGVLFVGMLESIEVNEMTILKQYWRQFPNILNGIGR